MKKVRNSLTWFSQIEELWTLTTQALTLTRVAEQQGEADGPAHKARKTKQDEEEDNLGQRVILVTEPHTDINAGLVIILGSDHESPLDLADAAEVAGQFPPAGQNEPAASPALRSRERPPPHA